MNTYENTFIRGSSPSFSDDVNSDNAISSSLQRLGMTETEELHVKSNNFLNRKYEDNSSYNTLSLGKGCQGTGLSKGRKTFVFWTIITLLLVLTIGNLILTLTIIGVLRLSKGIQGMELIPEEDIVKFYGTTDLDRIYSKTNGQIDGFVDVPVTITGDESNAYIKMQRNGQSHNRIIMDEGGINFKAVNSFEVKDPISGTSIFTTHRPLYNIPEGADNLLAKSVSASRLTSPIANPLNMESNGRVYVKGSEGIKLDSLNLLLQVENNIAINSTHGETILEASTGIFLDMDKIPIVSSEFGIRTGSVQYKLCLCMPHGSLFRIAIPRIHNGPKISCAHFSKTYDPCSIN